MSVEFSVPPAQPKPASRNEAIGSRPTPKSAADTSPGNDFSNLFDAFNEGANADPTDQVATGDKPTQRSLKAQEQDQPDLQANQPLQFTQTFQLDAATPRPVLDGAAENNRLNTLVASQALPPNVNAAKTATQVQPSSPIAAKGEPGALATPRTSFQDMTTAANAVLVAQAQPSVPTVAGKTEPGATPSPRLDPSGIADEKHQKSSASSVVVATTREASEMLIAAEMSKQFSRSQVAARTVAKAGMDDASQAQTALALRDVRDALRKPSNVDLFPTGFTNPEVAVAAVAAGVEQSTVERLSDRRQIPDEPVGAWGGELIGASNRLDTVDAATTSSFSAEMSVAEQVTYWVTHDVQNAELKLDGLGHEPVQVSISLRGNEALVDFRTDQVETRQLLEGAVAQLKELLRGEGLVLSGVSVGSSGHNGSSPQERRDRQGSRQASVNTPELMTVESSQRLPRHSGRAIDLFV